MAITISFNQDTGSISVEDYNFKKIERHKGKSLLDFPKNYIVIDIETTGLDTSIDSIIPLSSFFDFSRSLFCSVKNTNLSSTALYSSIESTFTLLSNLILNLTIVIFYLIVLVRNIIILILISLT